MTYMNSRGFKMLLPVAVLLFSSINHLLAQTNIAKYRFAKTTETYTPITGGTVFIAANTAFDQQISSAITIPTLSFGGASVSSLFLHANGYITFGAAHSTTAYAPLSVAGTNITGVISGFAADLGFSSGSSTSGATSEIRYEQISDEFVAQFTDVKRWNIANERITFQIRINSTTGIIKVIYGGPVVVGSSTSKVQVGLRGNSIAWDSNVNSLMIDDIPTGTTCNWGDVVTSNANTSTLFVSSDNANVAPVANLAYTWTPESTLAPVRTFSAVTNIGSTNATISWTAASGATQYNVQYRIPGTCNWTNFSGNPVTATSATLTGLSPVTSYQVRVQSVNSTTNAIWSHIPNTAGTGNGYATTGTFSTLCTTPNPGATIASSSTNLCAGTPVSFSVTNPNPGNGVTYQWQSSTDNITYTNISGATAATYAGAAAAVYYRNQVRCAAGPDSVTSTPIQLSYNNNITNVVPVTRCGTGTAALSATGSTGTTVRWYAAASGGSSLGSGNAFTTPVINSTTTYYAGAETIANGSGTLGSGTGVNSSSTSIAAAYPSYFGNGRQQYLITAAELINMGMTPGNITSLGFNVTALGTPATLNGYSIKMALTTATTITTFQNPTFTTVWGATNYTPTVGANVHTFTTPFTWDGTSNVLVDICFSNSVTGSSSATTTQTSAGFNATVVYYADGSGGAGACTTTTASTTSQLRPNMTFTGPLVCSSPRVAVTATVTPAPTFAITANQTVCNNAITPLSVTSPVANYTNYTWAPVTNLYTDVAATTPYTGGSASTVYFKSATAGTNGFTVTALNNASQCGAVSADTVLVLPGAVTAIATPSSICMSGTTTLSLIPSSGYGTGAFQWQSSIDNSTFANVTTGGTASTYTIPTTSTTTYYRAIIKNGAGNACLNSISDTARVYNPTVTGTTPANRCGTGTLTLGANGIDGTLKWYAAANGGASIGTGASFTTPSIATSTTYYVASESSPNVSGTIGTGTTLTSSTGYPTAFGNRWYQDWSQMVYTAAELNAAGLTAGYISSIKFNIAAIGSAAAVSNYSISLGNTTSTTLTAFTTAVTPVFGPTSYTSAVGINTINFTTPYFWDGTSNLIVDIRGTGINSTYNATTYYTATTGNTVVGAYSSSNNTAFYTSGPTNIATSTSRLNVTFDQTGCVSPRTAVVATINATPTAVVSPTGNTAICEGTSTTLTASGGGNYQWRNANGNITGQTGSTYNAAAGVYRVVASNATTGCSDTSAAVTVTENPKPVVSLGNDTTFCSGPSLTLNANNQGATYLWNDSSTNQTRVISTSGSYSVKVTNSFNCSANDTIVVTTNPTPVVNLGNDTNLCVGNSYTLNAANNGASYLWDNGSTSQTRIINNTGTYFVKVTNTFNCAASDTVHANYMTAPVVNLGNDIAACSSNPVTLNAGNAGGTTYLWDNGSTQQTRTVNASGTYFVTVANIANCKGSDTVQVTVYPNPIVNLGNDTLICHDIVLTLNAQNPGATYLWDNGSTEQTRNINAAGNYQVTVTDAHSCVGSDAIAITVTGFPSGTINAVHGDTATYTFNLLNQQNISSYSWDFGDGSPLVTGSTVQHRYVNNGQYLVAVLMHGVCNDSAVNSRTVEVYDHNGSTGIHSVGADKDLRLYPNPATNKVIIENISNSDLLQISIYNVIGQKVYDSKAENRSKHSIDVSALISGIYTVRIETSGGTAVRKFEVLK